MVLYFLNFSYKKNIISILFYLIHQFMQIVSFLLFINHPNNDNKSKDRTWSDSTRRVLPGMKDENVYVTIMTITKPVPVLTRTGHCPENDLTNILVSSFVPCWQTKWQYKRFSKFSHEDNRMIEVLRETQHNRHCPYFLNVQSIGTTIS